MFRPLNLILVLGLGLLVACSGQPSETDKEARSRNNESESSSTNATFGLVALDAWIADHPIDRTNPSWRLSLLSPLWDVNLDRSKRYLWKLETNQGDMTFELFQDYAPKHVLNAAFLSRIGYFDGLSFHRVIPSFMAQGGCPKGDGTGGPGYAFDGEFLAGNPGHEGRGMLSTANSGPGTDGSQFFITFESATNLNPKHTVYGRMIEGDATLRKLEKFGSGDGSPRIPLRITKAQIVEVERG